MQISVTGRQVQVSTQLKTHVTERLDAVVRKYFSDAIDAHIVFAPEGQDIRCDIQIHVGSGINCQATGIANDMDSSFELGIERAGKRLRRNKRRLRDHRRDKAVPEVTPAVSYVLSGEDEQGDGDNSADATDVSPLIVAEAASSIETLTVSHAVLRLDLGDLPVLMFRNRTHGRLNVVFRRSDGNIGWIDPEDADSDGQDGTS